MSNEHPILMIISSHLLCPYLRLENLKPVKFQVLDVIKENEDLGNCQGRAPLFFQNVETNTAIAVDIWVENLCSESNLQTRYAMKIRITCIKVHF